MKTNYPRGRLWGVRFGSGKLALDADGIFTTWHVKEARQFAKGLRNAGLDRPQVIHVEVIEVARPTARGKGRKRKAK